jgi:hypothetical protein
MQITLTCDCGARFHLDDLLVGQKVACPECGQPLEVPATAAAAQPRLCFYSLASIVLALLGAFTLIGTTAAMVLGGLALVQIRRRKTQLTGTRLALAGIFLGGTLTGLTVFLLAHPDRIPLDAWLRQRTMAGQVDASALREVLSRDGNVRLDRPDDGWGQVLSAHSEDPAVGELQKRRDLLLVHVGLHAFLDVGKLDGSDEPLSSRELQIREDLQPTRRSLLGEEDDPFARTVSAPKLVQNPHDLPDVGDWAAREWIFDLPRGAQTWRFLIRGYKKKSQPNPLVMEPVYVVRGYAPKRRFAQVEKDLRATMDSIRLPK